KKPFSFEERIVLPDGEVRRLLSRGQTIRDGSEKVVRLMGISQDITELRETESAMREAEARFQQAFDRAPIGMALVDLDDRHLLELHDATCELTGMSRDPLRAKDVESLIHPADRPEREQLVARLLSGESDSYKTEQRFIDASGGQVWVQVSSSLVRARKGEPLYRILQVENISPRKKAE